MPYSPDEYTKFYIVQALFKLMNEYEFEKISVTDVAKKAGVGRATFYRYFKRKEDVLAYYLECGKKEFIYGQHIYPRCKADHILIAKRVLDKFIAEIERFKLLRKARLEYIYLDYLNKNFYETFKNEYPEVNPYAAYCYAGMLYNVSIAWLDGGCAEPAESVAETIVNSIYFES